MNLQIFQSENHKFYLQSLFGAIRRNKFYQFTSAVVGVGDAMLRLALVSFSTLCLLIKRTSAFYLVWFGKGCGIFPAIDANILYMR